MSPSSEETPGHTGQELRVSLDFLSLTVLRFVVGRHGQVRRRSSRPAGHPFHSSFVWCVSLCFSCGLYYKKVVI